jgi:GNAT superfamily N-acetyltransferase
VRAQDIEAGNVFVLDHEGQPAGFYSLERLSNERVELGFLFLEPKLIGTGFGRALFQHACGEAARRGYAVLEIQGDPNAERFYLAMGARQFGLRESASIPDRALPTFEVELGPWHAA